MEKLYGEFERVEERRNRTIEGTGLGLNITRNFLELMGSRLYIESTYGEGSEFGFELVQGVLGDEPVGELNGRFKRAGSRQYRVSFTAEDARILVVDDTRVNLDVIRNLLKKTRIGIDTATSGEEALEYVRENTYDVIFLDHLMPHMDGPETLRRMRELQDNRSADAPVIALTANAVSGAKEEYLRLGFKDYLSKPVNSKRLEGMLFNYIPPEKIRTKSDQSLHLPEWLLESREIDAAEGLKNCSNEETYMIVLESFYEVISENADEIEDYYQKEDWENYTIKVHGLKSSAKTIGAVSLSEQAARLEKAGLKGDTAVILGKTEKLLAKYRSLLNELFPDNGGQ
jgi:CheY-like chemotaxis protein